MTSSVHSGEIMKTAIRSIRNEIKKRTVRRHTVPSWIKTVTVADVQGPTCPRRSIRDSALRFVGGRFASDSTSSRTRFPDLYNTYFSDDVETQGKKIITHQRRPTYIQA
jgi:hypothetical protein